MANYLGFKPTINTVDYLTKIPDLLDQLTEDVTILESRVETSGALLAATGTIILDLQTANSNNTSASTQTHFVTPTITGIITFSFGVPGVTWREFNLSLDGAASFTPIWPASVKWVGGIVPTWTAGLDIINFYSNDNGTNWYATSVGLGFA